MFRQRLKGGHRVGANTNLATSHPQQFGGQNTNFPQKNVQQDEQDHKSSEKHPVENVSNAHGNDNVDVAWNWDDSASNKNNATSASSHEPDIQIGHAAKCYQPPQNVSSQIIHPSHQMTNKQSLSHRSLNKRGSMNESKPQKQVSDEWGWGNEDHWEDWGNEESVPQAYNTNLYPQTNQQQIFPHGYESTDYRFQGFSQLHSNKSNSETHLQHSEINAVNQHKLQDSLQHSVPHALQQHLELHTSQQHLKPITSQHAKLHAAHHHLDPNISQQHSEPYDSQQQFSDVSEQYLQTHESKHHSEPYELEPHSELIALEHHAENHVYEHDSNFYVLEQNSVPLTVEQHSEPHASHKFSEPSVTMLHSGSYASQHLSEPCASVQLSESFASLEHSEPYDQVLGSFENGGSNLYFAQTGNEVNNQTKEAHHSNRGSHSMIQHPQGNLGQNAKAEMKGFGLGDHFPDQGSFANSNQIQPQEDSSDVARINNYASSSAHPTSCEIVAKDHASANLESYNQDITISQIGNQSVVTDVNKSVKNKSHDFQEITVLKSSVASNFVPSTLRDKQQLSYDGWGWENDDWNRNSNLTTEKMQSEWEDIAVGKSTQNQKEFKSAEISSFKIKSSQGDDQNLNQPEKIQSRPISEMDSQEAAKWESGSSIHKENNEISSFWGHQVETESQYQMYDIDSEHLQCSSVDQSNPVFAPNLTTGISEDDSYPSADLNIHLNVEENISNEVGSSAADYRAQSNEVGNSVADNRAISNEVGNSVADNRAISNEVVNSVADNKTKTEFCNPPVTTWDDEWGDGWEGKPPELLNMEESAASQILKPSSPSSLNAMSSLTEMYNIPDEEQGHMYSEDVVTNFHSERKESSASEKSKAESSPEVKNIEALHQELQDIFSIPSNSTLVYSSPEEIKSHSFSEHENLKHLQEPYYIRQDIYNTEPGRYQVGHAQDPDKEEVNPEIVYCHSKQFSGIQCSSKDLYATKKVHQLVNQDDNWNLSKKDFNDEVTRPLSSHSSEASRPPSIHSQQSQTFRPPSTHSSASHSRPSSNQSAHTSCVLQPHVEERHQMQSDLLQHPHNSLALQAPFSANDFTPREGISTLSSESMASSLAPPPKVVSSGITPSLSARKGSLFQPPPSAKRLVVANQFLDNQTRPNYELKSNQVDSSLQTEVECETDLTNLPAHDSRDLSMRSFENSLLANTEPPEQIVKLSIAALPSQCSPQREKIQSVPVKTVPLVIPGLIKGEIPSSGSSNTDKIFSAHISNIKPIPSQPKVHSLDVMNDILSSPGVLDLSKLTLKDDRDNNSEPPNFSRMVPGESTEGKVNTAALYQGPPSVVPSMPSGRFVTGNANPQPIPSMRIKLQEPNEVRSPPDGPDSGAHLDQGSGVVPPVRSETIGSEDSVACVAAPGERRDEKGESRRDRDSWERDNTIGDYYSERYRDREGGRDYYRDSSPHSRREFDPHYDDRRHRRRDTDDTDEDDHIKYSELERERRKRAYRNELDRYGDRDKSYRSGRDGRRQHVGVDQRGRDFRYSQDDVDPYYEGKSDRSRPASRSSSYGNIEVDGAHTGHTSRPHDDFYDRSQRPRDPPHLRDRDDVREREASFRDYSREQRREGKEPRDPYSRGYHQYADQYAPREMYDSQAYYYYYQNYQKYLQQHPYYREYYQQYYGRYGYPTGESLVDDKASTRSGRSSVNDEMKKSSLSSQFRQDFLDQSSLGAYEPSSIYPEHGSFGQLKSFPSGEISGVPSVTDEGGSDVPQRLSPPLFGGPHLAASFSFGGKLILVLPNDPKDGEKPLVQIRNVHKMLSVDKEYALRIHKMKAYPGPLTVNETHKDVVIRFCEGKALTASTDEALADKESVVLFWDYLALLVKQNGKVCGADLASILLKGREVTPTSPSAITPSEDKAKESILQDSSPLDEGIDMSHPPRSKPLVNSKEELVKTFTEYLCLGRKKEAVDYAIREGLWGYAMILAAKMDSITHTRVMTAFIHSIPSTDVLQTLIQHLSGKRPEVSKNYNAERWGDWRQHLAMMVSNPTGQPQRDRASIIALGDALAAKNRLHAAHLCYIAGEAEWGTFFNKESKLVLIGTSHHQPFQLFASEDAIQCTEIYEFAKSLESGNPMFYTFQSYKLIYALRLTECGFPSEALKYCEVISQSVMKSPTSYQTEFVSQVLELASQLKYHDVHYLMGEGEVADKPDPEWLLCLQNSFYALQYHQAQEQSSESANSVTDQAVKEETPAANNYPTIQEPSIPVDNTFANQSNISHQTYHNSYNNDLTLPNDSAYAQNIPLHLEAINAANIKTEVTSPTDLTPNYEDNVATNMPYDDTPTPFMNAQEKNSINSAPPSIEYYGNNHPTYQPWQQQQQQQNWQQQSWQQEQHQQSWQNQDPNNGTSSNFPSENLPVVEDSPDYSSSSYNGTQRRTSEEEQYWASMAGNSSKKNIEPDNIQSKKDPALKKESKEETEDKSDGDKKSSFLGSIFGGWRKGNNQAKLPDDKNPTIVWDENKKKWVNKDGDDVDETSLPPPPSILAAPPSIASLRGGNRKLRYIDPVGEKGRTKPSISPMMPPVPGITPPLPLTSIPPNSYMPGGAIMDMKTTGNQNMMHSVSESPDNSLLGESAEASGPIPMMAPPGGQSQAMFFNPSQFPHQNSSNNQAKRGPVRRSFNQQQ